MTNFQHIQKNVFSSVYVKIFSLILSFALRSVMLYTIGVEYIGLNGLFQSIFAFLNIANLGLSSAIVYLMYRPIAEDNTDAVCALLNYLRHFYRMVGIFVLSVGLILIPFLPHFVKDSYPKDIQMTIVYLILLVNEVIGYFFFAYRETLFTASQRVDFLNNVTLGIHILLTTTQMILLLLYRNFYLYCIVIPLMAIIRNLVIAAASYKAYPQYVCRGKLSPEQKDSLHKQTAGLLISQVSGRLTYDLDNIIISAFLGLTILGKYQNYALISAQLTAFVGLLSPSLVPSIGNSLVTETKEKNFENMNTYQFLYMWLNGWITACLVCLYQPFMRFWVGKDMMLPDYMIPVFGLYYITLKMDAVGHQYRTAAGLWWENRRHALFGGIFNVVMDIILVQSVGIAGVMLSNIIYQIFIDTFWGDAILFRNCFPEYNRFEYERKRFFYLAVIIISCCLCWFACKAFPIIDERNFTAVLMLLIRAAVCTILTNGFMWLLYHQMPEYHRAASYVKRLFSRNQQ